MRPPEPALHLPPRPRVAQVGRPLPAPPPLQRAGRGGRRTLGAGAGGAAVAGGDVVGRVLAGRCGGGGGVGRGRGAWGGVGRGQDALPLVLLLLLPGVALARAFPLLLPLCSTVLEPDL